jgi:hypothetical protein
MPLRLDVCVTAGPQHRHKQLRLTDFARLWLDHRDRLTGIVHKYFLASLMGQAHCRLETPRPLLVVLAELTVSVTIRVGLAVLHPQ